MFSLEVYFPGDRGPRHVERLSIAADVLTRVQRLLQDHDGCERIVIFSDTTRLFAVDCGGNRLPS